MKRLQILLGILVALYIVSTQFENIILTIKF